MFGVALGGVGIGFSASGDSISGVGAGMIFLAIIGYIIGIFVIMVVAMTFYGGIFEMVIGAARESRPVRFGDLFSGFKKFGAYALFAAVMAGIVIVLSLLNIIPILGTIVMIVVLVWIEIIWLYVLPLIADRGMSFGEAQARSREMVKSTGWWKTFGMLILLMVAIWVVALIIALISAGAEQGVGERRLHHRRPAVHRLRGRRRPVRHLLHRDDVPGAPRARSRPWPAPARPPPPPAAGTFAAPPAPPRSAGRAGDAGRSGRRSGTPPVTPSPGHHAGRAGHTAGHAGRDGGDEAAPAETRGRSRDGRHRGRGCGRRRRSRGPGRRPRLARRLRRRLA